LSANRIRQDASSERKVAQWKLSNHSDQGDNMLRLLTRLAPMAFLASLAVLALPPAARAQKDAATVFKANCILCHGPDGSGSTPTGKTLKAKDLKSDDVQKQSDAELAAVISKGRGKMPAFGSKFSPDVINSLVAYIRQLAKK
jgi:mono/diheme cytochrome c family protein